MAGLTCICQPDGMTANCELPPTSNWEGVVTLMMCILVAVLAMHAGAHIWVLGGLSSRENNTLLKNAPRPVGTMAGGLSPRVPSLGEPFDYPLSPPNIV